jgi:hypothetical protein
MKIRIDTDERYPWHFISSKRGDRGELMDLPFRIWILLKIRDWADNTTYKWIKSAERDH